MPVVESVTGLAPATGPVAGGERDAVPAGESRADAGSLASAGCRPGATDRSRGRPRSPVRSGASVPDFVVVSAAADRRRKVGSQVPRRCPPRVPRDVSAGGVGTAVRRSPGEPPCRTETSCSAATRSWAVALPVSRSSRRANAAVSPRPVSPTGSAVCRPTRPVAPGWSAPVAVPWSATGLPGAVTADRSRLPALDGSTPGSPSPCGSPSPGAALPDSVSPLSREVSLVAPLSR
jgi:hypothetical protein